MTFLYHLFCFFILSVHVDLSPHKNQCRQSKQDQQSCHQKLRSSCQHSSNIRIYNRCRKLSYTSCHKKRYKRHRSKSCCITYNIKRNKRKQTTDQNCILSIFFNSERLRESARGRRRLMLLANRCYVLIFTLLLR